MRGFSRSSASLSSVDAQPVGRLGVGPCGLRVLDHVAVEALAVADGRLEADGVLDELEQLADALRREAGLDARSRSSVGSRFELLGERCGGRA